MICIYAESHLCTFTLILYTCIWIPFIQTAQSILTIFTFFINNPNHHHLENTHFQEQEAPPAHELNLQVSCFQDLEEFSIGNRGESIGYDENEELCSICLTVFEKEDLVNKLPRCGHVFHVGCMEKWLERCQFTCPLCRSMVLHDSSQPSKMCFSEFCILPPPHDP
ncbi:RING/U-box superfamily protein [Striga asiatica]|uniref:RING/U-box superfamily protein n=1 Tax=Striga asiatica TaxID=4170 RepID=A0A5A7R600_STRAF|nr:RING/U-box superfamily protein [Striga asiatica]